MIQDIKSITSQRQLDVLMASHGLNQAGLALAMRERFGDNISRARINTMRVTLPESDFNKKVALFFSELAA